MVAAAYTQLGSDVDKPISSLPIAAHLHDWVIAGRVDD